MTNRSEIPQEQSPFLAVLSGRIPSHKPVWFMRQAGRSLPEYRKIRETTSMLDACFCPEIVTEITLQPVRRHKVDAAILFSDIVVPIKAAGFPIDIHPGKGPVTPTPVRNNADIDNFPTLDITQLDSIVRAVHLLGKELGSTALIGFAGAPFTLSSYLIEGGPSKSHEKTKAFMYSDEKNWNRFLNKLSDLIIVFLRAQIDAGAQAIQLFDSWAGTLHSRDYDRYIAPHSRRILEAVSDVPRIHFGVGVNELLPSMAKVGVDAIGIDWRISLDDVVSRIGPGYVLQGNLDPAYLFVSWQILEDKVKEIFTQADTAVQQGAKGHIFNLGHGVSPTTDPDILTRLVELVHSL